jgi:tRNA A37 threonylcarbamoyladenosine biosynthesis protein TsaE
LSEPSISASLEAAETNAQSVPSPLATGGAGNVFEQHVNGYFLTLLLVSGPPPILIDCYVSEVSLQNKRLGWHTDDALVVGTKSDGVTRRLLVQVKRNLTISAADKDFRKTISGFWLDYKGSQFSNSQDKFLIVTLHGSTVLLQYFCGLLEGARASADSDEFESRLTTSGLLAGKSAVHFAEVRKVVSVLEDREVSTAEVWPFLKLIHLVSYDFASSTKNTEAMAKTLLAHTCSEKDKLATADASWNALVIQAGEGMGLGTTYKRQGLSEDLRRKHSPVGHGEITALSQLKKHSATILQKIRTTLGEDLHLNRSHVVQELLAALRANKVVVVSGAAGSGKSGVAKDAILSLSADHFTFCFRAEEFACAHLDNTLELSKVEVDSQTIAAILSGQDQKIMLIESVERLLERPTRDAFTDLLMLVDKDSTWRLVLTCRDYSTVQVKSSLLGPYGIASSTVQMPPLTDEDLNEVIKQYPSMALPLSKDPLRRLLRTPYFLDKAIQMSWSSNEPMPETERAFRSRFWAETIRGSNTADGIHIDRERTFVDLALKRARALSMYADASDLKSSALQSLAQDSLIVFQESSVSLAVPAHDVLEDWAILHWIEDNFLRGERSLVKLSALIDTHPAVRRSYRKWISELLERDSSTADELFKSLIDCNSVPAQFSDDTLVSFLRSRLAPDLLQRNSAMLLDNSKRLLHRIIHLLRVACVAPPDWLENLGAGHASILNIPDGEAWTAVLSLVSSRLESFTNNEFMLLVGLIEDWSKCVNWKSPYPDGADSAAKIAYYLLDNFSDFGWSSQRQRVLKVIAKIPNAAREKFISLLTKEDDDGDRDLTAEGLKEIVFADMESAASCRDMPGVVISQFEKVLFAKKKSHRRGEDYSITIADDDFSLDNSAMFGLQRSSNLDYFPASAFRGPFIYILKHHLGKGVAFILSVLNRSGIAYSERYKQRGGEIHKIELTFPDGTTHGQIADATLWGMYRGRSAAPYVLQSALMALESILLGLGETQPDALDQILIKILRESDTVALTSVVSSVAIAFPGLAIETILTLLSSPECVILERRRMASESLGQATLFSNFDRDGTNRLYYEERSKADQRSHRGTDLEWVIKMLQFGPHRERIQRFLDRHIAKLPPESRQGDYERTWRLALHRMDLRQYTIEPIESSANSGSTEDGRSVQLLVTSKLPAADLQEVIDKTSAQQQEFGKILQLQMWGSNVFLGENDSQYDPALWRERLDEAKAIPFDSPVDQFEYARTGAVNVAAVCTRYHWDKLEAADRIWCTNTICAEIERDANNWSHLDRVQEAGAQGARAAAWVLPNLIGKDIAAELKARISNCLVLALTHPVEEIARYADWGIAAHLWKSDPQLAIRCMNAVASDAAMMKQRFNEQDDKPCGERLMPDALDKDTTERIRKSFFDELLADREAYKSINSTDGFGAAALCRILTILEKCPDATLTNSSFARAAKILVGWWKEDKDRPYGRVHDFESHVTGSLVRYLFAVDIKDATAILEPVLEAVDWHPEKLSRTILALISEEAGQQRSEHFWSLWQLFADKILQVTWSRNLSSSHPDGESLIYAMFLGTRWKEHVRHWSSLDGHAHRIDDFFKKLPPSSLVLDAYCMFLYHVGEQSVLGAFILIANSLKQGNIGQMLLNKSDTVFMLEALLRRHVYGKPIELKENGERRSAVLFILDQLVENGSSSAYKMRDDFVTPVPAVPVGA